MALLKSRVYFYGKESEVDKLLLPIDVYKRQVLTVTGRGKSQKGSINAVLFDMAARLSPLVHLDSYKRKKLEAQLKSAEIKMSPETYIAVAWVKACLLYTSRCV